jgi:hypothetical protein
LYRIVQDNKFQHCVTIDQTQQILWELHKGFAPSHFTTNITAKKILNAGYWWPTLFNDATKYCKSYGAYQQVGGLTTQKLAKLVITFQE